MITAIDWRLNLEFLFRLALAGACGATIGSERLNRLKSAGLRTHFIVAIASALMMIVSKYAYFDVVSEAVKLDPSRVAAGIVSGVSFLGAGMIFRRNQSTVTGLTTAAGIWARQAVVWPSAVDCMSWVSPERWRFSWCRRSSIAILPFKKMRCRLSASTSSCATSRGQ